MENTNYALSARNARNSYIKMAVPALLLGLPFLVPAVAFWWHKNGARRLEALAAERDALAQKDEEIASLKKELKKHQWVSVHNRMPGLDDEVLASDGNSVYMDNFLEHENGQYRMENPKTLYWMELPGLPK